MNRELDRESQRTKTRMNCFRFSNKERDESVMRPRKSPSSRSNSSMSTDREIRRSGSECSIDMSTESFGRIPLPYIAQMPSNLRIFMYQELRNATRNFSRALMLGEGGFGCVYRGTIKSVLEPHRKMDVAVKQLGRKGLQGHKEWLTEVNVLGMVDHQNLVKLIGYCAEEDERGMQLLLVYEFMSNRSLEDHLSPRSTQPLTWPMRLRIALDAARGLKYLHEEGEVKIIFRDLKPSNILLDGEWNAKLSDFGLARLGPQEESHVSTAVVGTLGYAAPEYLHTGRLATKSDVWSYGVVLYELITGRKPMDRNRPKGEQSLLEWIKPYISDVKKFPMIIDPRIEVDTNLKSIIKLGSVANKCLVRHPRSRPKMSEVFEMVQKIMDNLDNGGGTPEHLIMGPGPSEDGLVSQERKSGLELKRRSGEMKNGEGKWITWSKWTPKLVRTH
ncbi:Protein kinase superfamily protein [Rhynchospora pubera]|uniref:non-specific serine/threonine protein kinase n=2 Tax=Rhynchospora pubera TaxID=906938 RepID=A0AAV8E1T9_9POAL|nr:Protein kinase superfamily protein [Rhynchospora pubera]